MSPFLTACNQKPTPVSQKKTDNDSEEPVIWVGPGWYYGIWFSSEGDFHHWNHDHHENDDDPGKNIPDGENRDAESHYSGERH